MKFQYVKNVSEDNSEATMLLGAKIGNTYDENGNVAEYGINGYSFSQEMQYLKEVRGVKNITVDINSPGGSVLEGYTIANAIRCYGANTRVIGLAASMASICARAGEKCMAYDYATIMNHPVSGEDKKVTEIMQDSLKTLYIGRTKLNGDTANEIFSKETYFSNSAKADYTLNDALDMGIIDEIIPANRKLKISNKKVLSLEALTKTYNELLIPKQMSKVNALLGLKNEASEDAAVEAVEALKKENETLKSEKEAAEAKAKLAEDKLAEIEQKETEEKEAKAVTLVENAIKEKKVKAEDKDKLVNLAKVDFDTVKNMLDAKAVSGKAAQIFNSAEPKKAVSGRENWTIRDWEKNDSKGLSQIKNETPEVYQLMYDQYYKEGIGNPTFKK